jgi:uncharacterized membrane protein YebE (DUF533 family)
MSFGNILEQVLREGMAGQSRARLEHSVGPEGLGGIPGLGDLLGSVLGNQPGGLPGGGGLGDVLGSVLGGATRGASGGAGGLDDLLGGILGGGRSQRSGGNPLGVDQSQRSGSNPAGSPAMAILATLAMAALKNWSQSRNTAMGLTGAASSIAPGEMQAMTAPETEELVLLAMISAAKADGQVDEAEIQRIIGEIDDDGVSPAEKQFLLENLRTPLDLRALVEAVPSPAVAAQVYGASLLAMNIDTPAEAAYLRQLAAALELDAGTVARLHELTGAPRV